MDECKKFLLHRINFSTQRWAFANAFSFLFLLHMYPASLTLPSAALKKQAKLHDSANVAQTPRSLPINPPTLHQRQTPPLQ
jgi:hypothetical protein